MAAPRSRCCRYPSDDDSWWVSLMHHEPRLYVIGRLPFWKPRPDGAPAVQALVVATTPPDASEEDHSLLGLECDSDVSRARLSGALSAAGLRSNTMVLARQPGSPIANVLVDVEGYLTDDDARLAHMGSVLRRPVVLGAYAVRAGSAGAGAMTGPTPRPEILTIHPYVAGELQVAGANRTVKLSSNEGAFGVPPSAQAAIVKAAAESYRYPDGGADRLRTALGKRWGLDPARIVCGAGSDDLLYQFCLSYGGPGRDIIMSEHGFSIYRDCRDLCGQPGDQGAGAEPDHRP